MLDRGNVRLFLEDSFLPPSGQNCALDPCASVERKVQTFPRSHDTRADEGYLLCPQIVHGQSAHHSYTGDQGIFVDVEVW